MDFKNFGLNTNGKMSDDELREFVHDEMNRMTKRVGKACNMISKIEELTKAMLFTTVEMFTTKRSVLSGFVEDGSISAEIAGKTLHGEFVKTAAVIWWMNNSVDDEDKIDELTDIVEEEIMEFIERMHYMCKGK